MWCSIGGLKRDYSCCVSCIRACCLRLIASQETCKPEFARSHGSIPPLAVVMFLVVIQQTALPIEAYRAALFLHVDLKFTRRSPPLPPVILIAQPVQSLAERETESA